MYGARPDLSLRLRRFAKGSMRVRGRVFVANCCDRAFGFRLIATGGQSFPGGFGLPIQTLKHCDACELLSCALECVRTPLVPVHRLIHRPLEIPQLFGCEVVSVGLSDCAGYKVPTSLVGIAGALSACSIQNTNVSSSATRKTGAPPDEIETAFPIVCLPPSEAAHCSRASIEGK